jgi:YD repeat-containing protein
VQTVYSNFAAQVMLAALTDVSSGLSYLDYYQYAAGQLVLHANPSAVTGYDDSRPDLLNNQSGNYQYLSDTTGLIDTVTYAGGTTASSGGPGDVLDYISQTAEQRGEPGTAVPQGGAQYLARTGGTGATIYVGATDTVYRNSDGSGAEATSAALTWQGNTYQVASATVSLPVISAAQNGPGTADTEKTIYDQFGRPIWFMDADGFIHYTEYDQATGAVTKSITDVDTTRTGDFSNLPAGWSTPAGGGLHLITLFQVDALGRTTQVIDPGGKITYIVYDDINHAVRTYRGWNSATNSPSLPTEVYREDRANGYVEALTMTATPTVDGSGRPTGQEAIANLQTLARSYTNLAGQVTSSDEYFNLSGLSYSTAPNLGTEGVNYYRTRYGYDQHGQQNMVKTPTGTITRTVYGGWDQPLGVWVGTNDTGATNLDPTGGGAAGNNMVQVSAFVYDGGGVGDGNLTQQTQFVGLGAPARVTALYYDWRDREVASKDGVQASENDGTHRPIVYFTLDNLDEVTLSQQYDGDGVTITSSNGVPQPPSASLLRAQSATNFDDQQRPYQSLVYSVDPVSGAVSSTALTSNVWYGHRGQVLASSAPGGLVTKQTTDGAGRVTADYTTDGGGGSSWAAASSVSSDVVLQQVQTSFDASSNPILVTTKQRFHDETATGALGDPNTTPRARVSYAGAWYDLANRVTDSADVWPEMARCLDVNPGLQAKTLFNPDYSTPGPQGCRSRASRPLATELRPGSAPETHRPLTPEGEVAARGCPTGQPEGSGTGAGRGARRRSHTRRYQSRCSQLDESRTTIRRVLTMTSAATLMSRVRQVQGRPSPNGSRCRRSRKCRCRSAPVSASAGRHVSSDGGATSPGWLLGGAVSAGDARAGRGSAMNRRSRTSRFIAAACR